MNKIINYNNLDELLKEIRTRTIVLVGGCFDLLHEGHFAFLKAAKSKGEVLIIALESDKNIKKIKGNNRPINHQIKRAENLSKLYYVDFVILLPREMTDKDYEDLVKLVKPQIIAVTKNDPMERNKKKQAEEVGAKLITVISNMPELSTTNIINRKI